MSRWAGARSSPAPVAPSCAAPRGPAREEDRDDPTVWAITCFLVRKGHRGRGIAYALTAAAVDFARRRGAAALEGSAMDLAPGQEITWDEIGVGPLSVEEAGFCEVARPSQRRVVVRIDLAPVAGGRR